jgi:hypothetical protein
MFRGLKFSPSRSDCNQYELMQALTFSYKKKGKKGKSKTKAKDKVGLG